MTGGLELDSTVVDELRAGLPGLAESTIAALTREVPAYGSGSLEAEMEQAIQRSVELALATFLRVVTEDERPDAAADYAPALDGAYRLGRGEARTGRSMEALLAAYRVGARVAWQRQSAVLVRRDVPAETVATFAELVFSYIDRLSGASAAGHRDELATSDRTRQELRVRLAQSMLRSRPAAEISDLRERAGWPLPETLTAVVLSAGHAGHAVQLLDPHTLQVPGDLAPEVPHDTDLAVLLVPDAHHSRAALRGALRGRGAIIGPTRPTAEVAGSYRRALNAMRLVPQPAREPLDADDHLVTLVVGADRDALADLRAVVLRPFETLPPGSAQRLIPTLRAWVLHQGRRNEVAAVLGVHPQTVRYRMSQVRALYDGRLDDPDLTLSLTVALAGDDVPVVSSHADRSGARPRDP